MGLFSLFKKKPVVVPSLAEQQAAAVASVDAFLSTIYESFDKEEVSDYQAGYYPVAGITFHCSRADVGMVRGVTFNDENNPKDKTAVGILAIANNGQQKLLGFIPKVEKKDYRKFAGDSAMLPFIGYISTFTTDTGETGLKARVKIFKGCGNGMYKDMVTTTRVLGGAFKGYYGEQTLEEQGERLDWILDRHF